VHAVGERGTLPLGWQLYLPEEWCDDLARRRKAKIPDEIVHDTLEAAESSYLKSTNDHRRRILANPPCARDGALTAVASARRHPSAPR
jgi:hypothetical protein